MEQAPDHDGPTARIKIGTESNGAFRRISILDCVFERSRGLAIESVDGGVIEDVSVKNLTMHEVANPPIFLRLGNRARGPAGTPVGRIHRVTISNITAEDADSRYSAILMAGLPGHAIEDVTLKNIRIVARGGLTPAIVAEQPASLVNTFFMRDNEPGVVGPREPMAVPERERGYPEPSMFGLIPASAVYARHVSNLRWRNVQVSFLQADTRARVVLEDASGVRFERSLGLRDASYTAAEVVSF
jgi:polygalacturonase